MSMLWPDPEGRQVRECARVTAEYATERAELARRWRGVWPGYLRNTALAAGSVVLMALLSRHAAETMVWFYGAWFGSTALFALWVGARTVLGWFHTHTGYVAMSGHVWTCTVCGRPPKVCASEVPAPD